MLTESYDRAYKVLLENDYLYELEEIIYLKKNQNTMSLEKLKKNWDDRLEIVHNDIKSYERLLAIRSLVFEIAEDYNVHLQLAQICRKEDNFTTCLNVLSRLKKSLGDCEGNVKVMVELHIQECLYDNNKQEAAIQNIKKIIDDEIDNLDDSLKSKIYCRYGFWMMVKHNNNYNEETYREINKYMTLSTNYNKNNYKGWHDIALLNYKYFDYFRNTAEKNEDRGIEYGKNSISGFTRSVCIGGNNISKTLQDLLRLIDVWFIIGHKEEIHKLIQNSLNSIEVDSWLLVLPQILARVNIADERIRKSTSDLLTKIGISHPRAMVYP